MSNKESRTAYDIELRTMLMDPLGAATQMFFTLLYLIGQALPSLLA